jgi:hypothetical protein
METLVHKNLSDEFIYRYTVHRTGDHLLMPCTMKEEIHTFKFYKILY